MRKGAAAVDKQDKKVSVLLYADWAAPLRSLPLEDIGRLFLGILDYITTGAAPVLDNPGAAMAWQFMRMRLDVVFLNRESRVVGLHENLGCWRPLVWAPGAVTVLELPVGRIRESGTQMGHQLKLNQILRPEAIAKMRYGGILYHDGM